MNDKIESIDDTLNGEEMLDKMNDYAIDILKQYGVEGYTIYQGIYNKQPSNKYVTDDYYEKQLAKVKFCHQYTIDVMEGKIEEEKEE